MCADESKRCQRLAVAGCDLSAWADPRSRMRLGWASDSDWRDADAGNRAGSSADFRGPTFAQAGQDFARCFPTREIRGPPQRSGPMSAARKSARMQASDFRVTPVEDRFKTRHVGRMSIGNSAARRWRTGPRFAAWVGRASSRTHALLILQRAPSSEF